MKSIIIAAIAVLAVATAADAAKVSKNDAMFFAVCDNTTLVKSDKLTAACSAQEVLKKANVAASVKYPTAEVKVLYVNLPK